MTNANLSAEKALSEIIRQELSKTGIWSASKKQLTNLYGLNNISIFSIIRDISFGNNIVGYAVRNLNYCRYINFDNYNVYKNEISEIENIISEDEFYLYYIDARLSLAGTGEAYRKYIGDYRINGLSTRAILVSFRSEENINAMYLDSYANYIEYHLLLDNYPNS